VDKNIREAYTDCILTEAAKRYGITKDRVRLLDGFESFIYEYERDEQAYILRISHSLHRTSDLIHGEIEWMNHLADNGVPAARAVPSEYGNLVEPIEMEDGSHFTAVSFERARRQIPYFLKLREMDLYVIIHRSCDLDNLDPWCASFMDNRKYKIENDVPYVALDWERRLS